MNTIDPSKLGLTVWKVAGDEALVLCPFHSDSTPSASFNISKGLFHCFACGESATAKQLKEEFGGTIETIDSSSTSAFVRRDEHEWRWILDCGLALDNEYLVSRGISNDQVRDFELRDAKVGIAVVIRDYFGNPVGAQIRRRTGSVRYLTLGRKTRLWPMNRLSQANSKIWVVEGFFGVINAAKYGIGAFATMGSSSAAGAIEILKSFDVSVLFDDDEAGYVGAATLLLGCGAKIAIPGGAADEIDWSKIHTTREMTISLKEVVEIAGSPRSLQRLLRRKAI